MTSESYKLPLSVLIPFPCTFSGLRSVSIHQVESEVESRCSDASRSRDLAVLYLGNNKGTVYT